MNEQKKKVIACVVSVVLALLSFFVVAEVVSSPEFHAKTIQSLEEKQETVLAMTATATASSAAITLLPGDTGAPIANKLSDLSTYFLIILCALYLEKYLLTITGFATFKILIPIACILFCVYVFYKNQFLKQLLVKMVLTGFAIVLAIPMSVKVADLIEETYQVSLQTSIEDAKKTAQEIEENAEGKDEEGFFKKFLNKLQGGMAGVLDKFEKALLDFVESIAVMLVTSCIIPILVLGFFAWIIKILLGVDLKFNIKDTKKRIKG